MKKLVLGLVAIVLLSNSSFGQTIENLKTTKNQFNNKGEEYYNFLNNISNSIKEGKATQEEINKYIENSIFSINIELNDNEIKVYKSYFTSTEFNLNNLMFFENYLLEEDLKLDKTKLLESVAYLKWFFYFLNESSVSNRDIGAFERCLDNCMRRKLKAIFEDGNWIDQLEFIAGTPATTAWMVASCSWNCR